MVRNTISRFVALFAILIISLAGLTGCERVEKAVQVLGDKPWAQAGNAKADGLLIGFDQPDAQGDRDRLNENPDRRQMVAYGFRVHQQSLERDNQLWSALMGAYALAVIAAIIGLIGWLLPSQRLAHWIRQRIGGRNNAATRTPTPAPAPAHNAATGTTTPSASTSDAKTGDKTEMDTEKTNNVPPATPNVPSLPSGYVHISDIVLLVEALNSARPEAPYVHVVNNNTAYGGEATNVENSHNMNDGSERPVVLVTRRRRPRPEESNHHHEHEMEDPGTPADFAGGG